MNAQAEHNSEFTDSGLSAEHATRFLKLGLSGPRRPVDDLLDRLARDDAGTWFATAVLLSPIDKLDMARRKGADLATLQELKEVSKKCFAHPHDPEDRIIGLLGYFLAIGIALDQHGKSICSRSREDLETILIELAAVSPEEWRELLLRAVDRCSATG